MKKYFLPIFLVLFLCSCQNHQENTTPSIETTQPPLPQIENTLINVDNRNFYIPSNFTKFFEGKNITIPYATANALIVYTDKNNERIDDFKNINQDTTAHLFADSYCYNRKEDTTMYFKSTSCNAEKCEFPKYDHFTLEELEKKQDLFDLIHTSPWMTKDVYLLHPQTGSIPLVFGAIQDCNDTKKSQK